MARIKVTGYIETDDLDPDDVDLNDSTGLSAAGFDLFMGIDHERFRPTLASFDDIEFELED